MSKKDQIEALILATETELKLEEKKLEKKLVEAKEQREHWWIYLIWSVGFIVIFLALLFTRQIRW